MKITTKKISESWGGTMTRGASFAGNCIKYTNYSVYRNGRKTRYTILVKKMGDGYESYSITRKGWRGVGNVGGLAKAKSAIREMLTPGYKYEK